jgi:hypothetical protein
MTEISDLARRSVALFLHPLQSHTSLKSSRTLQYLYYNLGVRGDRGGWTTALKRGGGGNDGQKKACALDENACRSLDRPLKLGSSRIRGMSPIDDLYRSVRPQANDASPVITSVSGSAAALVVVLAKLIV